MRHISLLAALLAGAASAFAQAPAVETPKPKCEDPPAYPGRVGMQTDERRNRFLKAVENYKKVLTAARTVLHRAHWAQNSRPSRSVS